MNSLRSKLANKKVKGVFWPIVKSLRGVWAFFPSFLRHFNLVQYVGKKSFENVGTAAHIGKERDAVIFFGK